MVRNLLKEAARIIPLNIYINTFRKNLVGYYYHIVSNEVLPHIKHLYSYKTTQMFENDLIFLAKNFNFIPYDQLCDDENGLKRMPSKSFILTFDDGFSECFSIVRPLLLRYGIPCVFFVTTGYLDNQDISTDLLISLCLEKILVMDKKVLPSLMSLISERFDIYFNEEKAIYQWMSSLDYSDFDDIEKLCYVLEVDKNNFLSKNKPYMTTEEIVQLNNDGFTIGSHGLIHQKFSSLTINEIEKNIIDSCAIIKNITKESQVPFAFPHSADGVPKDLLRQIRKDNNHIGLLFGSDGIHKDTDLIINRVCGDSPQNVKGNESTLGQSLKKNYMELISRELFKH